MPLGVPCPISSVGNEELIVNAPLHDGITSRVRRDFVVPCQCVCIDVGTYELWPVCVESIEVLWSDLGGDRRKIC
ncbi:hypothetical protein DQ04_07931000 [Trypanosoma grayi]|uniref:hypothetical protein n=1 Tax=Trypanosoma grayi TaxID=71804 RepID=UPI0004F48FAF|nr:hypothetical protein DQ04_07931000 [Trypanosoma grayi]KEG08133.1 hypothetical protein DQ04_07931000 [Trypanosoma grayi]